MFKQDLETYEATGIVANESHADSLLWHYTKVDQEKQEALRLAQQQIDKINNWLDLELNKINGRIEWLEKGLKTFMSTTDKKTVKLPNGSLQTRQQQDRFEFDLDFMDKHPQFKREKVTYSLDKAAVKKHYKDTGEILEGLEVVPGGISFSVKL